MTHRSKKLFVSILLLLAVAIPNGWASPAQAQTTALFFARGRVTDNRGNPIANTAVHALPAAANGSVFMTNATGQWQSQHGANNNQVFKTGLQSTVQTQLNQDRSLHIVVAPAANQMENGNFESDLSGWTTGGTGMASIEASGHSGKAARLGAYCPPPCLTENEFVFRGSYNSGQFLMDSQENGHFFYYDHGYWLRTASGHWLHPDQPFGLDNEYYIWDMQIGSDDRLHVVFSSKRGTFYAQKGLNENWSNIETINFYQYDVGDQDDVWMDVDPLGQVHLVTYNQWVEQYPPRYYTKRDVDGNWSTPVAFTDPITTVVGTADGGAYFFIGNTMRRVLPDGTIQKPVSTGCPVVSAEWTNQGEIQTLCGDWPSVYRVMNANGEWRLKQTFNTIPNTYVSAHFSHDGSAIFRSGELFNDYKDAYWLKQPDSNELQYMVSPRKDSASGGPNPVVTRYGGLHLAYDFYGTTYAQSRVDLQTTEATLEQTVTVPDLSENPTLSFLYQIQGPAKLKESGFTLTLVDEGGTATNLRTDRTVGLWKHAWADLAPWAGQTVTLRFRYKQASGEPLATLLLDEVSLGAWETPVILTIDPNDLVDWASSPVTVTLTGSYFLEGAVVELKGQSIPATIINPGELTFALSGDLPPGHYNIRVINPDGKQSNVIVLRLGLQHYLPFAGR